VAYGSALVVGRHRRQRRRQETATQSKFWARFGRSPFEATTVGWSRSMGDEPMAGGGGQMTDSTSATSGRGDESGSSLDQVSILDVVRQGATLRGLVGP